MSPEGTRSTSMPNFACRVGSIGTYFVMHDLYEIFIETEIVLAQDFAKCKN